MLLNSASGFLFIIWGIIWKQQEKRLGIILQAGQNAYKPKVFKSDYKAELSKGL